MENSIVVRRHVPMWKLRGDLLMNTVLAIIVMLIIVVAGFYGFREMKDNANRTVANQELQLLKGGVIAYAGLSKDSRPPSSLAVLVQNPSLTAANAIDGVDHAPFVEKRTWTSTGNTILDPWGNPYQLTYDESTGTGTISSTGNGKPISVNF